MTTQRMFGDIPQPDPIIRWTPEAIEAVMRQATANSSGVSTQRTWGWRITIRVVVDISQSHQGLRLHRLIAKLNDKPSVSFITDGQTPRQLAQAIFDTFRGMYEPTPAPHLHVVGGTKGSDEVQG
jgi:hypothetical protein